MAWTSFPVSKLQGAIRAPGDKSCSHRALMFAGIAEGTSDISGLLEGEDVINTAKAMAALGAETEQKGGGRWTVKGVGKAGLTSPASALDFGNSGTGSRLMLGLMAGYPLEARLVGDASLSRRPMNRVIKPLEQMGARFDHDGRGMLPLTLHGSASLNPIDYVPEHASAQVKSCVLLAGLNAQGTTRVTEHRPTRDHTEKMLRGFGVDLDVVNADGTRSVVSKIGRASCRKRVCIYV